MARFYFTLLCPHVLRPNLVMSFASFENPFFANAWLGPHSEKECRTCAAEMYLADPSCQARSVKGSVATSMTEA
jgi:hypothetical protein